MFWLVPEFCWVQEVASKEVRIVPDPPTAINLLSKIFTERIVLVIPELAELQVFPSKEVI